MPSEVCPTFGSKSFRAIIAGGETALRNAVEGAEDNHDAGASEAENLVINDMAVGISASGRSPFVLGFLEAGFAKGARCWLMTCNDIEAPSFVHGIIYLPTGPELVAGSTRLKAGTATKLALNMISTAAMVRMGGVHDGLMVDVVPSNRKLAARAKGIIREITGCSEAEAADYLTRSGMRPKVAALMIMREIERDKAEALLERSGGSLRNALNRESP
jgi:N-acetylmuramic acid 6-phosphate etherase